MLAVRNILKSYCTIKASCVRLLFFTNDHCPLCNHFKKELDEYISRSGAQRCHIHVETVNIEKNHQYYEVLEDDFRTNCGFGSNLTFEGNVECEAAFASSKGPVFGAVGAVSRIRNPIEVAALIAKEQLSEAEKQLVLPAVLVGQGAEKWAQQHGIELCDPVSLISTNSREQWQKAREVVSSWKSEAMDTVGAVSYGSDGCCSAACSSGGMILKTEGRLGHTLQIGGAIWADQKGFKSVAVALSGCGEYIAQTLLARNLADGLLTRDIKDGCVVSNISDIFRTAFVESSYLRNKKKQHLLAGGLVLFDDRENELAELVVFHNTEELTVAFGGSGTHKKFRSLLRSGDFIAHGFPLKDGVAMCY